MDIYNVRRNHAGGSVLALFDLRVGGISVYNIELRKNQRGDMRVYAPSPDSRRVVTFDLATADILIKQARQALGGPSANDSNFKAA